MKITRLSWAGVLIETEQSTILIDPVEDFSGMEPYMGKPLKPVIPFATQTKAQLVLLTHLHPDHFDLQTIRNVLKPDGKVVCHTTVAQKLQEHDLQLQVLELNQTFIYNDLSITPVFALDGIGHEQVSWVVRDSLGKQLFHGGDTIWHNRFWSINKDYGKMHLALLPANGVVVNYSFVGFHPLPASLMPEQAVVAAKILQAEALVPIHYGTFHSPPVYSECASVPESLEAAALKYNQELIFVQEGNSIII